VEKAFVYSSKKDLEDPVGCRYDNSLGAWILTDSNEFLVKSNDPDRPRPTTKKHDLETGEDLKGA